MTLTIPTYDYDKRNWKRILTPEEYKLENAAKALRLNGAPDIDPPTEKLLAASSIKKKPTFRIKRLGSKLQSGSLVQELIHKWERKCRKRL